MTTTFNYQEYLASREWALLKNQVRERSRGVCERCHQRPYQATHHKTYERIGHELLDDLLGVCNPCHEYLSGKRDDDPSISKSIAEVGNPPLHPIPVLFDEESWFGAEAQQLKCPLCGFEYVHVVGGLECPSNDDYANRWVRGGVLRIHCWCENSHHFSIEFGFHKGGTFVRYSPDWGTYWRSSDEPSEVALARATREGATIFVRDGQLIVQSKAQLSSDVLTDLRTHRQRLIEILGNECKDCVALTQQTSVE